MHAEQESSKRPVCAPDLRAGQPPLQSLSPSGTHPIAQPSDPFRQVEQLTLLGGGCRFRNAGWLAAGLLRAGLLRASGWRASRNRAPPPQSRRRQGGPWSPGPVPAGRARELSPAGCPLAARAHCRRPVTTANPQRAQKTHQFPSTLLGLSPFTVSCIPVRQPANPRRHPAICTGKGIEYRASHVHARQTLTVAPRLSCPVPVPAASSLPPSSTLGRASERRQNIGRRQPHPRPDRTTPFAPAASPQTAPSGPSLARLNNIAGKCLCACSGPSAAGGRTKPPCQTWRDPWRGTRPASRR